MKTKNRKYLIFLFIVVVVTACAPAKWDMSFVKEDDLVWPPPPNPVRVKYLGETSAFVQTGESLKTIIFGKGYSGRIVNPVAVAVGVDGRMAIADTGRKGVHFFVPKTQRYLLLTEVGKDKITSPVSVAFDEDLRLYVSDSELRKVFIFDETGRLISEISGTARGQFKRPTGLTYNSLNKALYVLDTMAHKLHKFNADGNHLGSLGQRGTNDGEFNLPTHLAVDGMGRIYVNDAMNFRVQVFSIDGAFIEKFGQHGDGSGDFAMPKGVAIDRSGSVYVSETLFDLIQMFDIDGSYLMSIGSKGDKFGQFWMPSGIFIDRNDKLYVCDTYNRRIQLFQLGDITPGGAK